MFRISVVLFVSSMMLACVNMKPNQLFIDAGYSELSPPPFNSSTEIYSDFLSSEAWFTHSANCLSVEAIQEASYTGTLGLHLTWNKQAGDCPWLGLGFGWDAWTGKDLSGELNQSAVQFWARTLDGERKDLPWAIGLEDFTGSQAWLGMSTNAVKANNISTEWTRIELPLSEFNWAEQNADPSNIKQIIFNLEGEGEIYMDEVTIVPYHGGYRNRAEIPILSSSSFNVDGQKNDEIWQTQAYTIGKNEVHLAAIDSFLCVALEVQDVHPMQNSFKGAEIFNGDAFEIAFSTDPNAILQRTRYLSSDQHIAFSVSEKVNTWNWRKKNELHSYMAKGSITDSGYIFEIKINLKEFGINAFEQGALYGLEMVIDQGTYEGRERQDRWNEQTNPNYFENPFLWGELMILNPVVELTNP